MMFTIAVRYDEVSAPDAEAAAVRAWEILTDPRGPAPIVTVTGEDGSITEVDLEEVLP